MSYDKAMKWNKKHPKGTRQPILMHTDRGFTPAIAWLRETWWPYLEKCKLEGTEPMGCEEYYKSRLG